MTKYNVYFHNDLDGIVSAYLITKVLLKEDSNNTYNLYPVDHDIDSTWLDKDLGENPVIVDFLYHRAAKVFFDHHHTSFKNKEDYNSFTNDKYHKCDPKSKSCAQIIYDQFTNILFDDKELVENTSIIDSASYKSINDVYDYNNKYNILSKLIGLHKSDSLYLNNLVKTLLDNNLDVYLNQNRDTIDQIKKTSLLEIEMIKPLIIKDNNLCYCNMMELDIPKQRYLSYVYYPDIDYNIIAYCYMNKYYISLAYNPWKNNNKIDLGMLASKYNGGGHFNVSGLSANSKEDIIRISKEIIEFLKRSCMEEVND